MLCRYLYKPRGECFVYVVCVVMRRRNCLKGVINHCYQRPKPPGVIFYSISDFLLFFTIFCVTAPKYKVRVVKLVLMMDHIHHSTIEDRKGDLSKFVGEYSALFAREHNVTCHRKGDYFEHPFKSAPKNGEKKARTNLIYLNNNPVERRMVKQAEDYRWNFMAYAQSTHPFSEKIVLSKASRALRRALKRVQEQHKAGKHLPYAMLQQLFRSIPSDKEKQQLIDYIISTYNILRYDIVLQLFDSFEDELLATHSNTGSEYDIVDSFIGKSDAWYNNMTATLLREKGYNDIHEMLACTKEEKWELFQLLRRKTSAPGRQIAHYLRIPLKKVSSQDVWDYADGW